MFFPKLKRVKNCITARLAKEVLCNDGYVHVVSKTCNDCVLHNRHSSIFCQNKTWYFGIGKTAAGFNCTSVLDALYPEGRHYYKAHSSSIYLS